MLLNTLYTINDLDVSKNNVVKAKIDINAHHKVFDGHFPGQPVTPGVCLTNMITDTIALSFKKKYHLRSADFIKFINLVIPSQTPSVFILITILAEEIGDLRIEASIYYENTTFLKLKGNFGEL